MKKFLVSIGTVAGIALLSGCGGNGWDALPVDEKKQCFQVTEWNSNGWTQENEALGTYCKTATP